MTRRLDAYGRAVDLTSATAALIWFDSREHLADAGAVRLFAALDEHHDSGTRCIRGDVAAAAAGDHGRWTVNEPRGSRTGAVRPTTVGSRPSSTSCARLRAPAVAGAAGRPAPPRRDRELPACGAPVDLAGVGVQPLPCALDARPDQVQAVVREQRAEAPTTVDPRSRRGRRRLRALERVFGPRPPSRARPGDAFGGRNRRLALARLLSSPPGLSAP
jgi:hypothetical protein